MKPIKKEHKLAVKTINKMYGFSKILNKFKKMLLKSIAIVWKESMNLRKQTFVMERVYKDKVLKIKIILFL